MAGTAEHHANKGCLNFMPCGFTVRRIFQDCNTTNGDGLQYITNINGCKTHTEETDKETKA
jgi:hypothetical protein